MKFTREGLLLPERIAPAIDDELAESFAQAHLGAQETYKDLAVDPSKKEAIVAAWHEERSPDAELQADHLDDTALNTRLQSLHVWKADLLAREDIDPAIKHAYRWRINEDIANVHMLRASANGDMDGFRRWNKFIYGEPDEAIYRGGLDKIAHDAERLLETHADKPAVVSAASHVLAMLEGKRGYRELLAPDEETFEAVREDHFRAGGYYALLLAGVDVPANGKVSRETGDPILEHVTGNNLQSDYSLQDASGATWGVSHSKKAVERPATYNMVAKRFTGLALGHEIGSHLLERVNGLRGPLKLGASGLDRYELGNEGRATIREQVVYDTFDEFGKLVRWRDIIRRDVAIGYAAGVGEDGPKSSGDVYAFMNAIDTMYQAKLTPDDPEVTREKALAKTDALLLRVLKGGAAYLKDKVYLEGHVASWLTAATHGAERISEGDLGKFDINNPRHIALLQSLGLLPDNQE